VLDLGGGVGAWSSHGCFTRLRRLLSEDYFKGYATVLPAKESLDGCERFGQGDMKGAAEAWKPVVDGTRMGWLLSLAPIAFDAADGDGYSDVLLSQIVGAPIEAGLFEEEGADVYRGGASPQ
jgi:hypothetical protein